MKSCQIIRLRFLTLRGGAFFFLMACLLHFQPLFAATPPNLPPGSSAEIIEAKAREEIKARLKREWPEEKDSEQTPPGKEAPGIKIFLRELRLKPHPLLPESEFQEFVRPQEFESFFSSYEGREVSFTELSDLANRIENELRARGLMAVIRIPPQEVASGGEVALEVLLARMGELSLEGSRYFRKWKTVSYWEIPKGQFIDLNKIRQNISLMNDNPDRKVEPLLKAGEEPGTTDVVLKSKEKFPLHASYALDNQGIKLTGRTRNTLLVQHNNLLKLDDIFLIGTVFGQQFGAILIQHYIPVFSKGTKFSWGFSHAQVSPKKEFKEFGINGRSETYSLGLHQRLYSSDTVLANAHIGFDFKEKQTRLLSTTSVWDRLRILSAGADIQKRDDSGMWVHKQDFYFGFSPHGDGFALTSREAESQFFKYAFSMERQQRLFFNTLGVARFSGQLSPDKLVPQEQLFMGGATTVRGYPESDYGADQAILAGFEHRVPFYLFPADWRLPHSDRPLREQLQLLSFVDYGYGRIHNPAEQEFKSSNKLGVGGGLMFLFRENFSVRLEAGAPVMDDPLTESGEAQVYFRFQFTA